jgi:hypothetical protein
MPCREAIVPQLLAAGQLAYDELGERLIRVIVTSSRESAFATRPTIACAVC